MDTKEEVTEATTKPVDTLSKVTARLSVLFVVMTFVVFTGIVTLSTEARGCRRGLDRVWLKDCAGWTRTVERENIT